jgi:hypothetical protein
MTNTESIQNMLAGELDHKNALKVTNRLVFLCIKCIK